MDQRATIRMDAAHLAQYGKNTVSAWKEAGCISGRAVYRAQRLSLKRLRLYRDRLAEQVRRSAEMTPAEEWLLDNWYLAQREGLEGGAAFEKAGRLRAVRDATRAVYVIKVARAFIRGGLEDVSAERLAVFLTAVQQTRPLTEQELSLFISALKIALTERILALMPRLRAREEGEGQTDAMAETISALRFLSAANLTGLLEEASLVEALLARDPAGIYPKMDEETRRRYRQEVCRLARQSGCSERAAAQRAVELAERARGQARHVGWFLFRAPLGQKPRRRTGFLYLGGLLLGTLCVCLFLGFSLGSLWATLLLLIPVSEIIKNCADFLAVRSIPPRPVHRMALTGGIPEEGRTLCVIASLLTDEMTGPQLAALLERYRLANRDAGEGLLFGILADLPDSASPAGSRERTWVDSARAAIDGLNETYGGGFYFLYRPPAFHPVDERYMGWERKRGALIELARLLKNRRTALGVEAGNRALLGRVRYVITLDADTALNVGTARELVGAMLHPLNRPQIDPQRRVVTAGYGLLQPRVGVELAAANKSYFSRIFAGQGGVDPYGSAASDLYHDLFDEGTYTGKGIFDVDAFYTCLEGRFPENRILSHDLLEGAYLGAGLIGDVELTDSYPYKVVSYYTRLHRWVRGDWQLLPWLGRGTVNERGERERNPLGSIARWKIFDNLRRSLCPVCTLLALLLGMCVSGPVFAAAAATATLCALSNLLLTGADLAFRGGQGLKSRYRSTIIVGFGGVILQTLVQLLFLPVHAWVCASAIVTALWRQTVSRRGMLAWVTAADADKKLGDGVWANCRKLWPASLIGLVAMLYAIFPAGSAVGLVWLLSPVFAWMMSHPISERRAVSTDDRAFLLHQAALIWRFFSDFLRAEDNWLPPDNWQEQPSPALARRTSPTNIGMALLCVMAAVDLDLLSKERAVFLLERMISTVEGLPKWRGHCYNWHETATLRPLHPRYVSTVDSGNLCGCLIALREGLYEWGEGELARRAEALSAEMDFSALYDGARKLFYIGYDLEQEEYTQGWYDLMASEARQASYIAVARGEIDPRHWRRLSRALVSQNDYSGMASWTGTMFEYFMPNLLMPVPENSFIYESLSFCVYAQKSRAARRGVPWGISESAFYAFDGAMNYQYKAHGVQKLALKRGMDSELVVSPYSSFLALLLTPAGATRNLRRLRDLGLEGKYGLYEAADFTPTRLTGESKFEPVRTFMAHHLGMSLIAVDNVLKENVMQRRFLRDCAMAAFRELLEEKVPVGAPAMRSPAQEVPEKPRRAAAGGMVRSGHSDHGFPPACHLVSNGSYSVFCTADGQIRSRMGGTTLTAFLPVLPLTRLTHYHFSGMAAWEGEGQDGLSVSLTLQVPERENGELRELVFSNRAQEHHRGEALVYLEPVLAREEDYAAHPAFSKLFLESSFTGEGVIFTRRPRSRKEGTPALAVLWDAVDAGFDTSREAALGRGGLRALESRRGEPARGTVGAVLDPCLLVRLPLRLAPGESRRVRIALAASDSGEDALRSALRLLGKVTPSGRLDRMIEGYRLTQSDVEDAFELLRRLSHSERCRDPRELWPLGISGDLPVAAADGADGAAKWLGVHQLLTRSGFAFDLVFVLDEGGDYRRPARGAVREAMKALGCEHVLGAKGGVHLVETLPAASVRLPGQGEAFPPVEEQRADAPQPDAPFSLASGLPDWRLDEEGAVRLDAGACLPPVAWSMMLCNPRFGWMTNETGGGHLWLDNARENPITRWHNDPLAVGGPERFALVLDGERRSLFADGDGLPCAVTYQPGMARWEKQWRAQTLTTTAFVPLARNERVLLIEWEGERGRISHRTEGKGETLYPISRTLVLITTAHETRVEQDAEAARRALEETLHEWRRRTSALRVQTPDKALNHYLSGWALYQVIACRLFGRTSLYQNGGAFGFRDQLQDACAVILSAPALARERILAACARQFSEGDVLHWWHEEGEGCKGVRTRISDDLLWLPYVVSEYVQTRGEYDILEETAPYLHGAPLAPGEHERYEQPRASGEEGTVYDHAVRAIACALARGTGAHGLPLMGTGDWNDGMNLVGAGGRGESVWLSWFFSHVLARFAPLCERMGETERAAAYRGRARAFAEAAQSAWDGGWYLRGYYDDGATLGSHRDQQCQIDSIAQSFAVLAPAPDLARAGQAVAAAVARLFHRKEGVVQLFDPPFDAGAHDPGYISGYLPGVRENGGQYTHAAVWLALACLRLGQNETGYEMLTALLPAHHDLAHYHAEPYVIAADVYWNPAHAGRGGWSWYTGAAGWYYRVAVQDLLGLQVREGRLFVTPRLPDHWPGYTAVWDLERAQLHITVKRGENAQTLLNGSAVEEGIDLSRCEGRQEIISVIPRADGEEKS